MEEQRTKSQKIYDFLRNMQIILPGIGALYAALAAAWGWGYNEPVAATCSALALFLGLILKAMSKSYFDDKLIIPKEIPKEIIESWED